MSTMGTPAELVDTLLEAMADYDADALAPLMHDDVVWWSPASAGRFGVPRPITGRDEVIGIFCGSLGLYRAGTITWDIDQLIAGLPAATGAADDTSRDVTEDGSSRVAVVFTRRSLTAAGKPYENQYCFVLRLVEGRIAEGWEFVDTAHAFAQYEQH
jgi:ketosteroid isomerase-like protein